jgi:hypothetical protein
MMHPQKNHLISLLSSSGPGESMQSKLYAQALREKLPFFKWNSWLKELLTKQLNEMPSTRKSQVLLTGK